MPRFEPTRLRGKGFGHIVSPAKGFETMQALMTVPDRGSGYLLSYSNARSRALSAKGTLEKPLHSLASNGAPLERRQVRNSRLPQEVGER